MTNILALLLWAGARTAAAGMLSASGVAVLDTALAQRPSYSNNERIVFQQKVYNGVASSNRIQFKFIVLAPSGGQVLEHSGNAVPGSVGSSASQVSGIPISQFYSGPGTYTLKAQAVLDGQTVEQQAFFTISSPNIILIYPPNGAQGISEKPLTFRWSASGAVRYRVLVGDNPSFYNSLFSQETSGGENFLSYPENPSDPRLRLAAGQIYYWKVEGLDAGGAVNAQSAVPYSFTITAASLSKDLTMTSLAVDAVATAADGTLAFVMTVKNQGGTTESGVPLKFSVGGLAAPGTPIALPMLAPGESRDYTVPCALPVDQNQSLAIACLEFSDDNIANNCKTVMVNRPAAAAQGDTTPIFEKARELSAEELRQAIWELVKNNSALAGLEGYDLVGLEGDASLEDLKAILEGLKQNLVSISITGPALPPTAPALPTAPTSPTAPGLPAAPAPSLPSFEEARDMSAEELRQAIWELVKNNPALAGFGGYDLIGVEGDASVEDLKAILEGLKRNLVSISVTGPAAPPAAPPQQAPTPSLWPATPTSQLEEETAREWSGMCPPIFKKTQTYMIKTPGAWRRTWRRVSNEKLPMINFQKYMVAAIVAGRDVRADRIDMDDIQPAQEEFVLRYRLVVQRRMFALDAPEMAAARTNVPYLLRLVPVSPLPVRFEEADDL